MTETTTTKQEEARQIAQKIIDIEVDKKNAQDEQKELKEFLMTLIQEENVDTHYDLNQGSVFVDTTIKYEIPDGLKEEIESKVKHPDKLSPELIEQYFKTDLKLNKAAMNALRNSSDIDLATLVVETEKETIKVKLG